MLRWTDTPLCPLPEPRQHHDGALLDDGRVVFVGGRSARPAPIEESLDSLSLDFVTVLDRTGATVEEWPPMAQSRQCTTVWSAPGSRLIVVGGEIDTGCMHLSTQHVEAWSYGEAGAAGAKPTYRRTWLDRVWGFGAGAIKLGGSLVLSGGGFIEKGEMSCLSTARTIDPDTLQWKAIDLQVPRYLHAAVSLAPDAFLIAGGLVASCKEALDHVEIVDLSRSVSEPIAPLPFATAEPLAAALTDGRILLAGGYDDDIHMRAAVFDPVSRKWSDAPRLPLPSAGSRPPIRVGDHHHLFLDPHTSGDDWPRGRAMLLDERTLAWTPCDVTIPAGACVVALGAGSVVISGGIDEAGRVSATNVLRTFTVR